jgi:hypothetical protein
MMGVPFMCIETKKEKKQKPRLNLAILFLKSIWYLFSYQVVHQW